MTKFDLAVVGAGPGGSNAVAVALHHGLRVCQLDRQPFPRVKPCAGGVTVKASNALALTGQPSIRATHVEIEINLWDRSRNLFTSGIPILRMVVRADFDNALVEQSRAHPNFTFLDNEAVRNVVYRGRFFLETDQRSIEADQLVAADGAYSRINRAFSVAHPMTAAVAIEFNLPYKQNRPSDVTCFDFGAVPDGYGWVFPKDDHASVGLYSYRRGLKDLRRQLSEYALRKGFSIPHDVEYEAHQVPVGGFRLTPPQFPLYVVGDAGGFADALTGEGIYHALESGRLAGETSVLVHMHAASPRRYYRRLWRSVLPDTLLTYCAARAFYGHLRWGIKWLEHPLIWRWLLEGYAEGATLTRSLGLGWYYLARSYTSTALRHAHSDIQPHLPISVA